MVYLVLKKSYVERTMQEANDRAIDEMGEEGKDSLMWSIDDSEDNLEEIEEDGSLDVVSDSEIGYIYISPKFSVSNEIELIESIVKRLNKFKSLMESMK